MMRKSSLEILLAAGVLLASAGCSILNRQRENIDNKVYSSMIDWEGRTNYVWITPQGYILNEVESRKYGNAESDWKSKYANMKIIRVEKGE